MNNEPVAWISVLAMDKIGQKFTDVRISLTKTDVADIPLYTHPAKTLTDEEINKIYLEKYDGHMGFLSPDEVRDFARAILRKAQEK
jgi:C-terminal processing protease CtpA/Prc